MYYDPHSHLAIARARQQDMIREAERRNLAAKFEDERPGLLSRMRERLGRREPRRVPATGTV
jgi:hypothetical protein